MHFLNAWESYVDVEKSIWNQRWMKCGIMLTKQSEMDSNVRLLISLIGRHMDVEWHLN